MSDRGIYGGILGIGKAGLADNPQAQQNAAWMQGNYAGMLQGLAATTGGGGNALWSGSVVDPAIAAVFNDALRGTEQQVDPAGVTERVMEKASGPMDAILENRPRKLKVKP